MIQKKLYAETTQRDYIGLGAAAGSNASEGGSDSPSEGGYATLNPDGT